MKLVVDSGSTKTDWAFATSLKDVFRIHTGGINPIVQDEIEVMHVISDQLLRKMELENICPESVTSVYFYGAGCVEDKKAVVETAIMKNFNAVNDINIESDLLASARALCGRSKGIACILGTGANSCLYDGYEIIAHTPALGYILGDEGSGAALGKDFLNGILKGWLPTWLREEFVDEFHLTVSDIIDSVYNKPMPNQFLASLSKFIKCKMRKCDELEKMVVANFCDFIYKNIVPYRRYVEENANTWCDVSCKINAVGSVAYYYKEQLEIAASRYGMGVGSVIKSPMENLLAFHCSNP